MRTLHYIEPRRLEWRETVTPTLQDDREIHVRPIAGSVCDIDRPIIEGSSPFTGPFPIGHEGVAEVTEVGDAVTRFNPGDLVVVPWNIACGKCDRCRKGLTERA